MIWLQSVLEVVVGNRKLGERIWDSLRRQHGSCCWGWGVRGESYWAVVLPKVQMQLQNQRELYMIKLVTVCIMFPLQANEWGAQAALSRRGSLVAKNPLSNSETGGLSFWTVSPTISAQLWEDHRERCVSQTLDPPTSAVPAGEHAQPGSPVYWQALAGEQPWRTTSLNKLALQDSVLLFWL